ncbi:hypothetical protein Acr_23g0020570 [Actinidia rufa]|uniref:Uncharacterized protein n=1 Tax=Actinidia rufa TaxID=165716 RepID=A0A7J0GSA0_9ERIC|nr:hypothetical protein Acr_23g0020570 [Actinidia rufa]
MEGSPESPLVAIHPSMEEKTNIMTLKELNALRDTYSFPSGVQIRLPDKGETITSTRPGEVAFYEAAFPAGLRKKQESSAQEDTLTTLRGGRSKFFFVSGDEWEIPEGVSQKGRRKSSEDVGDSRTLRTAGDNRPSREAPSSSSDVGESKIPMIKLGEKALPETIQSRGKVLDPILDRSSNDPSSNSLSESCSDSSLSLCRKRVSFKKIGEKLGKTTGTSSGTPVPAKGVVIGDKRPGRERASPARPLRRGRLMTARRKKGSASPLEAKKKTTSSSKAPNHSSCRFSSSWGRFLSQSWHCPGGPTTSMLGSPSVAEKLLCGGDSPSRQGKGGEAHLGPDGDETLPRDQPGVGAWFIFWPSEIGRQGSRHLSKRGELLLWKLKLLASRRLPLTWKQQLAESPCSNLPWRSSNPRRSSWWLLKIPPPNTLVRGLTSARCNFADITPTSPSNLEGTVVDQDLLAEQDEAEEENDKEKTGENEGGNQK